MPGDDAPDQDLPVPDETPDVRTEPAPDGNGSGRSNARVQVPKPIPVDILHRATVHSVRILILKILSMMLLVFTMFQTMLRRQALGQRLFVLE